MNEVEQVDWSLVCNENNWEIALNIFMNLLMEIANRHAPLKNCIVRSKSARWLDKELLDLMTLRENANKTLNKLGSKSERQVYCQLRNLVTKLKKVF